MSRERPILFGGAMVRAILDGRKIQTRRVVKPQPTMQLYAINGGPEWTYPDPRDPDVPDWDHVCRCPYGGVGDTLWVRETWGFTAKVTVDGHDRWLREHDTTYIRYRATDDERAMWRPSIHMPRWASRLTLEVTAVRVERLQDITEEDAIAEGMQSPGIPAAMTNCGAFARLWNDINAKRGYSWESNPWVWVVSFRRAAAVGGGEEE